MAAFPAFGARALLLGLVALTGAATPLLAAETALTPTRVIYPGETVGADAVEEVALRRGRPPKAPVATGLGQVEGKVAKRTLVPGKLIPVSALREAWLVEPGERVEATFRAGALSISITAVALQAGAAGDVVRLRNAGSGKTFAGTVEPDGTVRVGSP